MRRTNVWCFLALALLGIPALATPVASQYFPDARRAYDAHWGAYADRPEELVRYWYRRYLNRDVDPVGYETWVNSLRSGNAPEMVLAGILSSDEYYSRGGGTPEGYVTVLVQDLTGRPPTPQEQQYWARRVYYEPRSDVAYALLTRYPQSSGTVCPDWYRHEPSYEYRRPFWRYRR
jgi:hypothetical protein